MAETVNEEPCESGVQSIASQYTQDSLVDLQVGEILPGLILGSQDVTADWEILKKHGVTHVLNIATLVNNYFQDKLVYRFMRIHDFVDFNILPCFPVAFKFIDEGRKAGCVLVHCNAGMSRAATICIRYLMKTEGMSFLEAWEHVKEKRPSICPNGGFITLLSKTYTETLKSERTGKVKGKKTVHA